MGETQNIFALKFFVTFMTCAIFHYHVKHDGNTMKCMKVIPNINSRITSLNAKCWLSKLLGRWKECVSPSILIYFFI